MKEQKEAIKSGKLKISSAAAKLNDEMMGIENKSDDSKKDLTQPLLISHDQVVADTYSLAQDNGNESGTITSAKQAANQYVAKHPESLFGNKKTQSLVQNEVEIDKQEKMQIKKINKEDVAIEADNFKLDDEEDGE